MNRSPSFTERLDDWLDDGPMTAPADLLATIVAELPATGQRRIGRWWKLDAAIAPGWAVAIAAVAVIGVAVAVLWPFGARLGEPTTPTPTSPLASPSFEGFSIADVAGRIAFRSGAHILAVDPDNPGEMVVLGPGPEPGPEWLPGADPMSWSRDGTRLLLGPTDQVPPRSGFLVWDADGTRLTVLDRSDDWEERGWGMRVASGSLSPDGSEFVFAVGGDTPGPYVIDPALGSVRSLGEPCSLCGEPLLEAAAWSPDGSRIAWVDFVEDSITYGHHAYVLSFVNADGTNLRAEVAPVVGEPHSLAWSPDGSQLAYWVDDGAGGDGQIVVVNEDGSGMRIVMADGNNRWPAWSPDGSRIAFVRDGVLATVAPDGTDLRIITGVEPDGPIAWNPLPPR
jgi:hypothetical protein